MSGDSSLELQKAIYDVLRLDATLGTRVSGVFDFVPQDTKYPYVVVGETTVEAWDTKGTDGADHTVTIHSWSQYGGFKEVKEIMEDVVRLLHNITLAVTGHDFVLIQWEFGQVLRDPDTVTSHGVQRFRTLTQEV